MKRLALVLAAAFFGAGCIVHDDDAVCDRLMTLEWEFQDFDGVIRGCTAPQREIVDAVDVWVDGFYVTSFFCEDLGGTISISSLAQLVTVEGIAVDGRIAYRHEFVPDRSCADQLVLVTPAQGTLRVDYAFSPVNECGGSTLVELSVRDDIAALREVLQTTCSTTTAAPEWSLPVGTFTLEWTEEVTGGGQVLAADCADRSFFVDPAGVTLLEPTLLDTPDACPR
jgi:hypothetical protein